MLALARLTNSDNVVTLVNPYNVTCVQAGPPGVGERPTTQVYIGTVRHRVYGSVDEVLRVLEEAAVARVQANKTE